MSKVKYRVREYNPKSENQGSHSLYAEVVINSDIDNSELAKKIAARTGFKAYECQGVIAAIADIVAEEVLESNRITLSDEKGNKFISIAPRVQGSVSDLDIERETTAKHAADPSVEIRTVATEKDLTSDRLSWNLASTVGLKFSKRFAMDKQAQKVTSGFSDVSDDEEDEGGGGLPPSGGGDNSGGGGGLPGSGGEG